MYRNGFPRSPKKSTLFTRGVFVFQKSNFKHFNKKNPAQHMTRLERGLQIIQTTQGEPHDTTMKRLDVTRTAEMVVCKNITILFVFPPTATTTHLQNDPIVMKELALQCLAACTEGADCVGVSGVSLNAAHEAMAEQLGFKALPPNIVAMHLTEAAAFYEPAGTIDLDIDRDVCALLLRDCLLEALRAMSSSMLEGSRSPGCIGDFV